MSRQMEVNRRDFLKATAQASAGLAALGGIGSAGLPQPAAADPAPAQTAVPSKRGPKANWPQEYAVRKDEENQQWILSTPYYSVHHDLKKGGA
ncbi:MAG: twin-arginine translocation signal domain-containing protein, partial [Acidobacteriota bacterium]|nr:twin-arginine translocation signal domain-containing protein [Acidobacteriota bacterium]